MLNFTIIIIVSYLIGCLPSAYLFVKIFYKKNIFNEGTGNNGAANSIDVTGSKTIGLLVMLFDFFKAFMPLVIANSLNYSNFELICIGLFIVIGHNYNILFGFKGGRGLSSSAGLLAFFAPILVPIWLLFYFPINIFIRKIKVSSLIALIAVSILALNFDFAYINFFNVNLAINEKYLLILSVFTIVLSKHLK